MAEVTILTGGGVAGATISGAQTSIDPKTTIGSGTSQNPVRAIGIVGMPDAPGLTDAQKTAQLRAAEPGVFGMPVTATGHLAKADSLGGSVVVGVLPGSVVAAEVIEYSLIGILVALVAVVWDAVTGQTGGLTPGAVYYLSDTTAGHLMTTPPSTPGHYVVPIGIAISATTMVRIPAIPQVVGGGASNPSVEHKTTVASAVTLSPTVNESFVAAENGADGPLTANLADGSTDGFQKTVFYGGGPAGCSLRILPAHGVVVTLPETGGAAILAWNATTVLWTLAATYGGVVS